MDQGSQTFPPTPLGMRAPSFGVCEKACVFAEDAGRRCGRRGQRSHFRLEDANSIIQIKKKLYSFTEFASSKELRGRCPRLPGCLPASSYKTRECSRYRYTFQCIFLIGARGRAHIKPEMQCGSDITFFTGE